MHYYKFNIADWGLGTSHLSLEEEAIYFRLINFYYDSEKPIPLETHSVIRRLRMGSHAETVNTILTEFFEETDKGWVHSRCEKDLKDYRKTAKKNKLNGAKGGRPSKDAAPSVTQNKPSGLPNESQNNPNQEPLTTNHKPLTKEIVIPDGINQLAWSEWVEFRKQSKKKITPAAAKKQFKLLSNYALEVQQQIIDQSIQNDYQGLFEPKGNTNGQQNKSNGHASSHRQTLPERVKAGINQQRAARGVPELDGEGMAETPSHVRVQVHESVRGVAGQHMGQLLEGDYSKADS